MVAQPRPQPVAATTLRLVPPMTALPDDPPAEPIDLHRATRVKNTIRCRNELCKLPLVELARNHTYLPLHAFPIRHDRGTSTILCTCPACGTDREVTLR